MINTLTHSQRKCESVNAETQQAETELTKINQTLDELKSALEKIFKLLECNARSDRIVHALEQEACICSCM